MLTICVLKNLIISIFNVRMCIFCLFFFFLLETEDFLVLEEASDQTICSWFTLICNRNCFEHLLIQRLMLIAEYSTNEDIMRVNICFLGSNSTIPNALSICVNVICGEKLLMLVESLPFSDLFLCKLMYLILLKSRQLNEQQLKLRLPFPNIFKLLPRAK